MAYTHKLPCYVACIWVWPKQRRPGEGRERNDVKYLLPGFLSGGSYHVYVIILILNILNALDTADHSVFEILSPVASFSHFLGFVPSLARLWYLLNLCILPLVTLQFLVFLGVGNKLSSHSLYFS